MSSDSKLLGSASRFVSRIQKLIRRIWIPAVVKEYAATLRKKNPERQYSDEVVLLDFVDSYSNLDAFSRIAIHEKSKGGAELRYFDFRLEKLDRLGVRNRRLDFLYRAFGCEYGLGWREAKKFLPESKREAEHVFERLRSKEDLVNLRFRDIPIGTLVYDSYLRFEKRATVDLADTSLKKYLAQAYMIYSATDEYLCENDVRTAIVGDVAYIYSGIVARLCVTKGVAVVNLVEGNGLLINRMDKRYYRRKPYWNYKQEFESLETNTQEAGRKQGRKALEARLSGSLDSIGQRYMSESAYSPSQTGSAIMKSNSETRVLVPLHCFFDSPHVYGQMLFPDFMEWIQFTLERAEATRFDWYVKPHPNGLPENDAIVAQLKERFKKVTFLDKRVSNARLVAEGLSCVFTVYGSIAHELPYLGIPVVCAGDNPHMSFDFCETAGSLAEYVQFIENADTLKVTAARAEIEAFYYMHFLRNSILKEVQPIYPDEATEIALNIIPSMAAKEKRRIYHTSEGTLRHLLAIDSEERDAIISRFLETQV